MMSKTGSVVILEIRNNRKVTRVPFSSLKPVAASLLAFSRRQEGQWVFNKIHSSRQKTPIPSTFIKPLSMLLSFLFLSNTKCFTLNLYLYCICMTNRISLINRISEIKMAKMCSERENKFHYYEIIKTD